MHLIKRWDLLRLLTMRHLGIASMISQIQFLLIIPIIISISLIPVLEVVGRALYR